MLQQIPTADDFARLYYELGQLGARTVGKRAAWAYGRPKREKLLALAMDMTRYDPRLFEAVAEFLGRTWHTFCPLRLRRCMSSMWTPQTFGVVGEFVQQLDPSIECAYFFGYVLQGWTPVSIQLYYHHHYLPGSRRAFRAATESVAEFRTWGFLTEHGPILHQALKRVSGTYDTVARHNIVSRLLEHHPTITVKGYLTAVHHSISRQQAYLDLKAYPGLAQAGHGRGSQWRLTERVG